MLRNYISLCVIVYKIGKITVIHFDHNYGATKPGWVPSQSVQRTVFYSHNYLKGYTFFLHLMQSSIQLRSRCQTKASWWRPLENPVTTTIKREMRVHGTVGYLWEVQYALWDQYSSPSGGMHLCECEELWKC